MPPFLFTETCNVLRRTSQGRDSLNNVIYGAPTSGAGWSTIYTNMPMKLAFSSKAIQFATQGERPEPSGIVYFGPSFTLYDEDRIVTTTNPSYEVEYVVTSVVPAFMPPNVVNHWEATISLPG